MPLIGGSRAPSSFANPLMRSDLFRRLVVLSVFALGACASPSGAIRLAQLTPTVAAAPELPSVIGPGDLLSVRVWNAEQMTVRQRVRPDGTIALFFMDSLIVAGQRANEVEREVVRRLDGVMVAPKVTVVIEESAASMITVLGEVARPGSFAVHRALRVLDVLAMAGGLTEYARRDQILLQRRGTPPVTLRVTFDELLRGDDRVAGLLMGPGDVLIVR
jgi:polysaccharide export outer membrane protein